MTGKGRAEHGGGAAKWRHGWIPVNAAARAIVAAREARKAEPHVKAPRLRPTEESSSVGYRVEARNGVFHVLDSNGKVVLTTAHKRQADAWIRSHGQEPPADVGLRVEKGGSVWHVLDRNNRVVKTFRTKHSADAYVVSLDPALVDKSKVPVTHPFDHLDLSGMAKIDGEHTAEADAINSNPDWLDSTENPDPGMSYTENCALCVQAWELRRRGYAVQAGPLTEWMGGGMQMNEIADLWRYPSGVKARFSFEDQNDTFLANLSGTSEALHRAKVDKVTKNWPVGARGFVGCVWKQGGGHIFGVEKTADGLHYYDPQPGRDLGQADTYFKNMAALGVMRIDDKVPTQDLENTVVPGRPEGAPYRPGRGILTSKPTPEGMAALDKLIAKVEKNGQTASAEGDDITLQASKTIVQAYKDARGHTPNEIMALSKRNVDSYLAGGSPDQYDTRRNALRLAMAVQHPGLSDFAKTEVVAIENQGGSPPGDLASVAAAKVTGLPMAIEDSLIGANPHYGEDPGYSINCVNAVWAYEQRRRGNDEQAIPIPEWTGGMSADLALASLGGDRNFTTASHSGARTIMQNWPVGARGFVQVYWKGGLGGHIFVAEREADGVHYLDPQIGKPVDLDSYFNRATNQVRVARTDDLPGDKSTKWMASFRKTQHLTVPVDPVIAQKQAELDRVNQGMKDGTKDPVTWGPVAMKMAEELDRLQTVKVTGVSTDQGPSFPKIAGPHDWKTDLTKVNPNYDHVSPMVPSNRPWITNCVSAVTAFDMRMRGYDVQAVPCPDGLGWQYRRFASQYRTTDGSPMDLSAHSVDEVLEAPQSWPDGAWGVTDTNRHIFVIMKQGDEVVYLDPQSGNVMQRGRALSNFWSGLGYSYSQQDRLLLRMDNLQPVENADWLVQGGGTNGSDVRAGTPGGSDASGPQVAA